MFLCLSREFCVLPRQMMVCVYLFFFKQKTAYEMRISDWSSDVCSSDLAPGQAHVVALRLQALAHLQHVAMAGGGQQPDLGALEIGRASCRERVCQYV